MHYVKISFFVTLHCKKLLSTLLNTKKQSSKSINYIIPKCFLRQVSLISLNLVCVSPLQAQGKIDFIRIQKPSREVSSISEEPLKWTTMLKTNKSEATKHKIIWSTNIISSKDGGNVSMPHKLKWEVLPYSEKKIDINILLNTEPSVDIELLIPKASNQK